MRGLGPGSPSDHIVPRSPAGAGPWRRRAVERPAAARKAMANIGGIRPVPSRFATTGFIVRWFGTNTDITEHKRTEEDLRTAEQVLRQSDTRFRELEVERSPFGIYGRCRVPHCAYERSRRAARSATYGLSSDATSARRCAFSGPRPWRLTLSNSSVTRWRRHPSIVRATSSIARRPPANRRLRMGTHRLTLPGWPARAICYH